MSLWMLLLIVLLTVTAVVFFSMSISSQDARLKKRYRMIATVALVAAVGIVVMGVLRGRKSAQPVLTKRGKRVKFIAEDTNTDDFNNNNDFNDEFMDDFDDLPRPPGIIPEKPAVVDSTALLAT